MPTLPNHCRHLLVAAVVLWIVAVAAPVWGSPYSDAVLAENPVAYWRFENDTTDSSGNSHTGTLVNAPGYTTGPTMTGGSNTALDLTGNLGQTGVNQRFMYAGIPTTPDFNIDQTQAFTLMAWINPSTYGPASMIMAKEYNSNTFQGYYLLLDGAGLPILVVQGTSGNYAAKSSATAVPLNAWSFLVATYNGDSDADNMRIYLNGVDITAVANYSDNFSGSSLNNTQFNVGSRWNNSGPNDGSTGYPLIGAIDEAALFHTALSEASVDAIYDARNAVVQEAGPVPEPAAIGLLGLAGLALRRRRSC